MSEVTARQMALVTALKHSFVTSSAPGLSVNTHPNAFFLNVIGELDLLKAATYALTQLNQFDEHERARQLKEAASAAPAPVIADPDGHG